LSESPSGDDAVADPSPSFWSGMDGDEGHGK
jgi:hypothetical protein